MINNGEKIVISVEENIEDDSIIKLSKSEYDKLKKDNFIANAVMQYLYDNSSLSTVRNDLVFDTMYLSNLLQAVDTEYYFYTLAEKRKEEEEKNAEKQTRSEE